MGDYAKLIRADAALSGRLLRLVNSAYAAQRSPVTSLDRACALLGVEKLRSFALGFYLSRAAATDPASKLSRAVWTQSVFRACLSAELARTLAADHAAEAFVVGLLLDAGVPLMSKLAGASFDGVYQRSRTPSKLFLAEFRGLPYTHVDVITVLMARWRMPDVLARPIEWHHIQPGSTARPDAVYYLRRIAYAVGAIELSEEPANAGVVPVSTIAVRTLGMDEATLAETVRRASVEYQSATALFAAVADGIGDLEQLAARVHNQLSELLDRSTGDTLRHQNASKPPTFVLGGLRLELRGERGGDALACIFDSAGSPLVTHRFRPEGADADTIRDAIGLTSDPSDQDAEVNLFLHSLAA